MLGSLIVYITTSLPQSGMKRVRTYCYHAAHDRAATVRVIELDVSIPSKRWLKPTFGNVQYCHCSNQPGEDLRLLVPTWGQAAVCVASLPVSRLLMCS